MAECMMWNVILCDRFKVYDLIRGIEFVAKHIHIHHITVENSTHTLDL